MRPFSIYHTHLELFQQAEKMLLEKIKEVIEPDIVYLLGATLKRNRAESIFSDCSPSVQFLDHLYFLVIIPESLNRPLHEWQEMIEQACSSVAETVFIVVTKNQFFEWLANGNRFARIVEELAVRIMLRPGMGIPCCGTYNEEQENKEISELQERGKYMASEFLAGAEVYIARQNWNLAAFMLHQALEQALTTLLYIKTGYEQKTHNLKRIIKYVLLFDEGLKQNLANSNWLQVDKMFSINEIYYNTRYYIDLRLKEAYVNDFKRIVYCIIETSYYSFKMSAF